MALLLAFFPEVACATGDLLKPGDAAVRATTGAESTMYKWIILGGSAGGHGALCADPQFQVPVRLHHSVDYWQRRHEGRLVLIRRDDVGRRYRQLPFPENIESSGPLVWLNALRTYPYCVIWLLVFLERKTDSGTYRHGPGVLGDTEIKKREGQCLVTGFGLLVYADLSLAGYS